MPKILQNKALPEDINTDPDSPTSDTESSDTESSDTESLSEDI